MDRLRAMEYLVRVVAAGGFARAARELDVSPPAVTKLVAALERDLGTRLLRRDSRRLSLTPDGEQFLPVCAAALADLRAAEAGLSVNRTRASGKLTVGMARVVAPCVTPFLPQFLAQHPEMTLDLRVVQHPKEPLAALVDVLLFIGWLDDTDMVAKRIAQTRFVTCAAPAYWRARGRPRDPAELQAHDCLAFRLAKGTVLDLWKYRRGEALRTVAVEPRVVSDDREWITTAAIRGAGVVRVSDLTNRPLLEQGLLEPVLADWEALEPPPIHVLYRRGSRPSARVRAFVDFAAAVFADLEASRAGADGPRPAPVPMPAWFRSNWAGPLARRARSGAPPAESAG